MFSFPFFSKRQSWRAGIFGKAISWIQAFMLIKEIASLVIQARNNNSVGSFLYALHPQALLQHIPDYLLLFFQIPEKAIYQNVGDFSSFFE